MELKWIVQKKLFSFSFYCAVAKIITIKFLLHKISNSTFFSGSHYENITGHHVVAAVNNVRKKP